ncbi:MAG: acyl-CoA thioesterase [Lachnospiraceae bacterium]|nr:acyl-CoA thioesterase [Lachnospiraceae bacterium]
MEGKRVSDSRTEQIHVIMYPDINGIDRLFGGQLLKWIDEVAGATARRHCGHDATTVAIDNMNFKAGAYLNDVIVLIGKVTHVGNTSMEVRVNTYREAPDGTRYPINRAYFVMVNMGTDGKPTPAPPLIIETEAEQMEWDNAVRRRELRLMRQKEGF